MPRKSKPVVDIAKLTQRANDYTKKYISNTSLGLSELDGGDFQAAMNAVVKAIVNAWAAGYMDGKADYE